MKGMRKTVLASHVGRDWRKWSVLERDMMYLVVYHGKPVSIHNTSAIQDTGFECYTNMLCKDRGKALTKRDKFNAMFGGGFTVVEVACGKTVD